MQRNKRRPNFSGRRLHFERRPLLDPISKAIGVGPDYAKQNYIPHSLAAANKRIELRRELLRGES